MTEESFDNVSINSEGYREDISVSSQDKWDDGNTDESTDKIKLISSKFNILQMTGGKTIEIDKNDVVTYQITLKHNKNCSCIIDREH